MVAPEIGKRIFCCPCRNTDQVVLLLFATDTQKQTRTQSFGKYVTSRGFSSVRAAQIAIRNIILSRFIQLNGHFDLSFSIYELHNRKSDLEFRNQQDLVVAHIPHEDKIIPFQEETFNLEHFHRSFEELKLNSSLLPNFA